MDKKKSVAVQLGNIGIIYQNQEEYSKALEYHNKALVLNNEAENERYVAVNIGINLSKQGKYVEALKNYFKALEIDEKLENKSGISRHLSNVGIAYYDQGDMTKALEYLLRSLDLSEELGTKTGLCINLGYIGTAYTKLGETKLAESTLNRALSISKEIGMKEYIKDHYKYLSALYDTTKRPGMAFDAYKLYIIYRDSISNEENTKAQTRTEMKYEYEKAELVAQQAEQDKRRKTKEVRQRRDNLQYSVILLGLLILGSLVLGLGKLSVSTRVAEGLIFFSFLILFEFILVLGDPYVDEWTGGAPGLKLLINAGVAALIFPMHSFFEVKLKSRLVKK